MDAQRDAFQQQLQELAKQVADQAKIPVAHGDDEFEDSDGDGVQATVQPPESKKRKGNGTC